MKAILSSAIVIFASLLVSSISHANDLGGVSAYVLMQHQNNQVQQQKQVVDNQPIVEQYNVVVNEYTLSHNQQHDIFQHTQLIDNIR